MSPLRTRTAYIGALVCALGMASAARAFDALIDRLPAAERGSELFRDREVRARVKDGPLIGRGVERTRLLPDRRLEVVRIRTYDRVVHPESGKIAELPDRWHVRSKLLLSPALRLIRAETQLEFHRSIDRALDYPFSEDFEELFAWDREQTVANRALTKLTRTSSARGRTVERDTYDYPRDAIPIEIVGMVLAHAVANRVSSFEFELLLPGGDTHGVRSRVHRTRDLSRFAKGYPVSLPALAPGTELAVVDLWLASPVKRLFFPHHFYFVYASADPSDLIALWGGDPDEHLQAFRE